MTASADPVATTRAPARVDATVHLTFIPAHQHSHFFLWGQEAGESRFVSLGKSARATVLDEHLTPRSVRGYTLPLLKAVSALATMPASEVALQSASVTAWSLAAKLACELITRERVVPHVIQVEQGTYATSSVIVNLENDIARMHIIAAAMPLAARAALNAEAADALSNDVRVWTSTASLQAFFDAVADALVRDALPASKQRKRALEDRLSWPHRFIAALSQVDARFYALEFTERSLLTELETWTHPVLAADDAAPRLCLKLELPGPEDDEIGRVRFALKFFLRAPNTDAPLLAAEEVFRGTNAVTVGLGCSAQAAEEYLLRDLSLAARLYAPMQRALREARPNSVVLTAESAWNFIAHAKSAIAQAGIEVILPDVFNHAKKHRLQLRMRIGQAFDHLPNQSKNADEQNDAKHVNYRWEVELSGQKLTAEDLDALTEHTGPLLRYRDQWVAVQPDEVEHARRLLLKRGGRLPAAAALAAVLSETIRQPGSNIPIAVVADGAIAAKLKQLHAASAATEVITPADFQGNLRPYQVRGVAWLEQLAQLGLGACLADDMGLGKTIQLIAYLLRRRDQSPGDVRPTLLVCPTSVIGNWQRELARFAPSLPVHTHDGATRTTELDAFATLAPATVVITSYAILRRDTTLLTDFEWSVAVLDEAQNIKNAESITARTARSIAADMRIALTGTPVENRLDELWSICEFLNPGLLGPLATFRREIAVPIERFGREDVAETLKRIVRPLILRRVKTDTSVIQDLPDKQENKVFCLLTREQALLYQAAFDENLAEIEAADGIERRGLVLKLITALKQICNHPDQYLKEHGSLAQRSGKLERLREMLEEVLASGESALVFTQYREMGARLVRELTREFGREVLFLHGGVPRAQRDAMVLRFQDASSRSPIFVLSLKAGGTGLNLTAATHVFHYDRWWNPAVEDQATDRAYRIGQHERVQVHKFLCAGTIEDRVNALLESKRDLAAKVVGDGEQWMTELNNEQLRELFALSPAAVMETSS